MRVSRKCRVRAGAVAIDAVVCTAVAAVVAGTCYVAIRTFLSTHLAFIEAVVGSPLM